MELKRGRVVFSKAGRDKDTLMVVLLAETANVLLCDGKERPLERPKRKNIKHVAATKRFLSEEQMATNRAIRRALAAISGAETEDEREGYACRNRI